MAGRAKADCGANLMDYSYALNGAGFALVARGTAVQRRVFPAAGPGQIFMSVAIREKKGPTDSRALPATLS